MSKKYVFDWCKCDISVVHMIRENPVLNKYFLGQTEFFVVFLKQQVSQSMWAEYKARLQARFRRSDPVIVCTTAQNMMLDDFLSNDVYHVFDNLYEEAALIKVGRKPLSTEKNLYFLVLTSDEEGVAEEKESAPTLESLQIEIASPKDAYYIWAASDADDSEFIGDDNGCYFYSMMKSPISAILKSVSSMNEIIFVAKYRGQIYGYAHVLYTDKKKYKFEGPTELVDKTVVSNTFHVAKLDTICSFSKWTRLQQAHGGFRGVGGKLWRALVEYTATEVYPFDYTVIHCLSLAEAVRFHLSNNMIANSSVPLLQHLVQVSNESRFLPEGDACKKCMYFILPGARLGEDRQRLKGGARSRSKRRRSRSRSGSRGRRYKSRSRSGSRGRRYKSRSRSGSRGRRYKSRSRSSSRGRSGSRSRSQSRSPDVIYFSKSNKADKKYMVTIGNKTVHFGAAGMSDYTHHKDPERKKRYIGRHNRRESWSKSGLKSAGFWSRWILWNKPSLQASILDTQRRFGIKIRRRS